MFTFKEVFSGFTVNDLGQAKEFYTSKLGFKVNELGKMGLQLVLPSGGYVFIYQSATHKAAEFTILNLKVDDIDQAVEELLKVGIVFERYNNLPGPQDEKGVLRGRKAGYGPDVAWFKDPFDNIISVLEE